MNFEFWVVTVLVIQGVTTIILAARVYRTRINLLNLTKALIYDVEEQISDHSNPR